MLTRLTPSTLGQGEIEHGLKLVKTTDPSLPVSMVVEVTLGDVVVAATHTLRRLGLLGPRVFRVVPRRGRGLRRQGQERAHPETVGLRQRGRVCRVCSFTSTVSLGAPSSAGRRRPH